MSGNWAVPAGQPNAAGLVYRTKERGDELERELLERLPATYAGERAFLSLDCNEYHRINGIIWVIRS